MNYIIGTGYYESSERDVNFYQNIWLPNTLKYSQPEKIVVVNSGSPNRKISDKEVWIDSTINLGHVNDNQGFNQDILFTGWTAGFIQAAMYAYTNKCDFIYKEQDWLAFGNWVRELQETAKTKNKLMLTGELWGYNHGLVIELSLIYLKYEFIIPFLIELLSIKETDRRLYPETKFVFIRDKLPNLIGTLDFGYAGNRPFNENDETFYIQKPRWWHKERRENAAVHCGIPDEELKILSDKGLI